jgi:molybdopterin converting factor small subunit
MTVPVQFYSYFKELAGCDSAVVELPEGSVIEDLLRAVHQRFPALAPMGRSTLVAVGVEYQPQDYLLKPGDQVSLFPPVQGG